MTDHSTVRAARTRRLMVTGAVPLVLAIAAGQAGAEPVQPGTTPAPSVQPGVTPTPAAPAPAPPIATLPDIPAPAPRPDNRPAANFWNNENSWASTHTAPSSDDSGDAEPGSDLTPAAAPGPVLPTTLHAGTSTFPIPEWLTPEMALEWNRFNDSKVNDLVIAGDNMGLSKEESERRATLASAGGITGWAAGGLIGSIPGTVIGAVGGAAIGGLIGAAALGIPTAGLGIPVGAAIGAWLGMTAGSMVGLASGVVGAAAGAAIGFGLGELYAAVTPVPVDAPPAPTPVSAALPSMQDVADVSVPVDEPVAVPVAAPPSLEQVVSSVVTTAQGWLAQLSIPPVPEHTFIEG